MDSKSLDMLSTTPKNNSRSAKMVINDRNRMTYLTYSSITWTLNRGCTSELGKCLPCQMVQWLPTANKCLHGDLPIDLTPIPLSYVEYSNMHFPSEEYIRTCTGHYLNDQFNLTMSELVPLQWTISHFPLGKEKISLRV
jgi:hypothetical protein